MEWISLLFKRTGKLSQRNQYITFLLRIKFACFYLFWLKCVNWFYNRFYFLNNDTKYKVPMTEIIIYIVDLNSYIKYYSVLFFFLQYMFLLTQSIPYENFLFIYCNIFEMNNKTFKFIRNYRFTICIYVSSLLHKLSLSTSLRVYLSTCWNDSE